MKNSADLGECYPPRPSASVDITLLDLQNSSYPMKAEFNNCYIYIFFNCLSGLSLANSKITLAVVTLALFTHG